MVILYFCRTTEHAPHVMAGRNRKHGFLMHLRSNLNSRILLCGVRSRRTTCILVDQLCDDVIGRDGFTHKPNRPWPRHRRSQGAKGPCPPKFLKNIVILCFGRRFSKQSSVIRLKSYILASTFFAPPQIFGLATPLGLGPSAFGGPAQRYFL